jgi:Flp pilus assembly protein TadB
VAPIAIEQPTSVADFPPRLAEAVAATLREHGVTAEVVDRGDAADVVVPAARRDDALALMASRMDEIRDRAHEGSPEPAADQPEQRVTTSGGEVDEAEERGMRPLVSERLRQLWPVPVVLVPMLVLLGSASVPANYAVLIVIGGMVLVVALRQQRRRG